METFTVLQTILDKLQLISLTHEKETTEILMLLKQISTQLEQVAVGVKKNRKIMPKEQIELLNDAMV
jgi:hypothetical protein